ncbi:hypothetical protein [Paenibacillus lentus]|uniref:Uncharacterized protein n=1 Tax=Paenibacillus lentus TaxID=1338368 RepID=A0A3Q8S3T1_9BACL|nr:hypothetical protein [Paenibacillus lentus]AZK45404.1 hypothetical protein EIM92_03620 [Paenibacillus lentus]
MLVIRTLNDVRSFIDNFNTYAEIDENNGTYVFSLENGNLRCVGIGITNFYRLDEQFYHNNYGMNWRDKLADEVDEPQKFVWENRKWINAKLKRNNEIDY